MQRAERIVFLLSFRVLTDLFTCAFLLLTLELKEVHKTGKTKRFCAIDLFQELPIHGDRQPGTRFFFFVFDSCRQHHYSWLSMLALTVGWILCQASQTSRGWCEVLLGRQRLVGRSTFLCARAV